MPKSDDTLDISDLIDHPLPGPSLAEDTASMPVVDRCEEEDCSDSVLRLMKMMKVSSVTLPLNFEMRVQLEGEGTYECSATGLVFEVSEQALVRYSVRSWSEVSKFLHDSWRPAGSIYDVDVVNKDPSVLKFIHFPHSLCLDEPMRELSFSVLHVKERHADIESTVGFTASHVKWRVSSLSLLGLILRSINLWMVEHHAMVLIYKELNKKDSIFQVYLGLNSDSEIKAIEEQVNKYRKKCIRIYKPANCTLVSRKYYHLKSEPEGEIEPSKIIFTTEVLAEKVFSEAHFDDWSDEVANSRQKGFVQNRSKPVKKKPSCSSGQGSRPGEVSSSPPPKMPKSDDTLVTNRETHSGGQELTEMQLMTVAQTLGQEWEQMAIHLGLETKDLENIKAEQTVAMRKHNMLVRWKRLNPGKATAQHLLSSLEDLQDLPSKTRPLLRACARADLTRHMGAWQECLYVDDFPEM
ncbi:unnamed protein product [Boreogadus saida]